MDAAAFNLPWQDALAGAALMLRATAFVAIAPVWGADAVPLNIRAGIAFVLVVLIAPVVPAPPPGASVLGLVATETFIGLAIGFVSRLVTEMLSFAGNLAGYPTGLAMANMLDPVSQVQTTSLAIFYQIVGMLIFFAIDGPQRILAILVRSYELVPAGTSAMGGPWLPPVVAMTGQVLSLGLRLAAPVLVAGLLVDVCLMLVARAVPQMNILVVGAPVRTTCGLMALAYSLHVAIPLVGEALELGSRDAALVLQGLARR